MTDAAGISYSGGGKMLYNTDSKDKTINFTFTSAASPAVTTTFTMTYRVFDTSYIVGPDYEEIAREVVVKLQDECKLKLFNQYLMCKLDENSFSGEEEWDDARTAKTYGLNLK